MPELESPDHSTCQHCEKPISWDDWCYTHDDSGFADCGVSVVSRVAERPDKLATRIAEQISGVMINPVITQEPGVTTRAEPIEWRNA